jgi:hypothetical protein
MKKKRASLMYAAIVALVCFAIVAVLLLVNPISPSSDKTVGTSSSTIQTTLDATPTPASTTATTTPTSSTSAEGGLIAAGPSRSQCLAPNFNGTGVAALNAAVKSFDDLTDTNVTCISSYLNDLATWQEWENPWITDPTYGYNTWVEEDPQNRQLILQVNLIPDSLENINNPLKWERSCAEGDYNSHVTEFGRNLVAGGLANSVLRLGAEANGIWENDFIGTTAVEQKMWAKCFDREVTALRKVPGEHFLIDWNPNACKDNYPYANYYPGNAYVDIMGLDLFDVGCETPFTRLSFTQLANEPAGLTHFEAFAAEKGKPMSFPEWGLSSIPSGDDPAYIDGMASAVENKDFAFETYFDGAGKNIKAIPLSSQTPLSVAAFQQWFGNGTK